MATPTDVTETLGLLSSDPRGLDGAERVELLARVERARSWIDAQEAELLAVVHAERDDVNAGAKDVAQLVKNEANVGFGLAKRRSLRSVWLAELPALARALSDGTLGTAQVDELCALADRLAPEQRAALRDAIPSLISEVAPLTPPRTRRHLADFEASLDADGRERLARQRRTAELRLTKNSDNTVGIHGNLDPIAGARVRRAIDDKVTELWAATARAEPTLRCRRRCCPVAPGGPEPLPSW